MPIFFVADLAKLFGAADDLDRLLILLGLNCGFGAAESGRLHIEDCFIRQPHPRQDAIREFDFQPGQSFVSTIRPKSHVLGDWLLWDATVQYLEKAITRANEFGSKIIICRSTGNPLYSETSKNAQAAFSNRWARLRKRVADESVAKLPFGALRDTSASIMRDKYGAELASLQIQHGSPVNASNGVDPLLQFYSTQPVGKLFGAQKELEAYYSPIWQ